MYIVAPRDIWDGVQLSGAPPVVTAAGVPGTVYHPRALYQTQVPRGYIWLKNGCICPKVTKMAVFTVRVTKIAVFPVQGHQNG